MTVNLKPNVVDLSHYDNVTDWDAVKAFGILGVINKATEGPGMADRTFAIRRPEAAKRGILFGAYHYLRPGSVTAQVRHMLDVIGDPAGIGLALDHEDPNVPLASAQAFCECMKEEVGRYPWLYSGFLIKQQLGQRINPFWRGIQLWLSHYSTHPTWPPCWDKPFLIQFTGDGVGPGPHHVDGIAPRSGIDIDSFDGTAEQLAAAWAGGVTLAAAAADPATVAPPIVVAGRRQTGITMTNFGGPGDVNESAYEPGKFVDPTKPGVALPFHLAGTLPKVRVYYGDKSVVCDIVDVGPHNTRDDYWTTGARPLAESQGGNRAGIDGTPAVFDAFNIAPNDPAYGKIEVDWEFV
jgi:GH25 family lysozyme M1 (1,4-beta-N-acetylmuramidase)